MILYLTKASTCDQYLDKRDNQFRRAALVITYILTVITGVFLVTTILTFITAVSLYSVKFLKSK